MIFLPPPFMADSGAPKVLTFRSSSEDATNLTSYSFASKAIGTAVSDRYVIVSACCRNSTARTLSTVTIGGVSAAIVTQVTSGFMTVGLAIAAVPTGTTATIDVVWSGPVSSCGIGLWSATGLTTDTPVDADTSTGNPSTATLTTLAGGFGIAAIAGEAAAVRTTTWTNATERYDITVESPRWHSGADEQTTGSAWSPSAAYSSSITSVPGAYATW